MKIPDWQWLKRRMQMDSADEELGKALAELEKAEEERTALYRKWHQVMRRAILTLPEYEPEPLEINMN